MERCKENEKNGSCGVLNKDCYSKYLNFYSLSLILILSFFVLDWMFNHERSLFNHIATKLIAVSGHFIGRRYCPCESNQCLNTCSAGGVGVVHYITTSIFKVLTHSNGKTEL